MNSDTASNTERATSKYWSMYAGADEETDR